MASILIAKDYLYGQTETTWPEGVGYSSISLTKEDHGKG
jgi:hypothetical protein